MASLISPVRILTRNYLCFSFFPCTVSISWTFSLFSSGIGVSPHKCGDSCSYLPIRPGGGFVNIDEIFPLTQFALGS